MVLPTSGRRAGRRGASRELGPPDDGRRPGMHGIHDRRPVIFEDEQVLPWFDVPTDLAAAYTGLALAHWRSNPSRPGSTRLPSCGISAAGPGFALGRRSRRCPSATCSSRIGDNRRVRRDEKGRFKEEAFLGRSLPARGGLGASGRYRGAGPADRAEPSTGSGSRQSAAASRAARASLPREAPARSSFAGEANPRRRPIRRAVLFAGPATRPRGLLASVAPIRRPRPALGREAASPARRAPPQARPNPFRRAFPCSAWEFRGLQRRVTSQIAIL
jgi:hypothetical protein